VPDELHKPGLQLLFDRVHPIQPHLHAVTDRQLTAVAPPTILREGAVRTAFFRSL
jgi:hypothetical protein